MTANEKRWLLEACDAYSNPMLGWMVRLALNTGMRAGEIRRLRRGNVDMKRRIVTLRDTKNCETRAVPLLPAAVAMMEQALSNPIRPIETDLVFVGEPGCDGKQRGFE